MSYRLLVLDIDGTLRPSGQDRVPRAVAEAVCAVQRSGVRVAIATGRGRCCIPKGMLRSIRPDYWLCAAGAQLLDRGGAELAARRMTPEEMYALVDFFEDHDLPLRFVFRDATYAYLDYPAFAARSRTLGDSLRDGEDQDRHLQDMPFTAFGHLSPVQAEQFRQKYGYLGLRFVFEGSDSCDILSPGVDKADALAALLRRLDLPAADCVAVGDSDNDAAMLALAGLGVAVEGGSPAALAAADRTCPSAAREGVADLCRELWPAAFAGAE